MRSFGIVIILARITAFPLLFAQLKILCKFYIWQLFPFQSMLHSIPWQPSYEGCLCPLRSYVKLDSGLRRIIILLSTGLASVKKAESFVRQSAIFAAVLSLSVGLFWKSKRAHSPDSFPEVLAFRSQYIIFCAPSEIPIHVHCAISFAEGQRRNILFPPDSSEIQKGLGFETLLPSSQVAATPMAILIGCENVKMPGWMD